MTKSIKLIATALALVLFLASAATGPSPSRAQPMGPDADLASPSEIGGQPMGVPAPQPLSGGGPSAALYDNGPLVTHAGQGAGGADASALQTARGMTVYGFGNQAANGNRLADDFPVASGGRVIDTITFFGYQTGSTTQSTFTSVNLRIWNGPPNSAGSQVVFGDTTTNRLISSTWSSIYRVLDTDLTSVQRPVMANVVAVNTFLAAGTYWLDWQADGTLSAGPWAPPVTILGQTSTGNALQYVPGTGWQVVDDSGTLAPQGLPFLVGSGQGGGDLSVSGRITSATGSGVPGVTVWADDAIRTTTDNDGDFTLAGLDAGTYTIRPSRGGYTFSPASRQVSVPPSASNVNFRGYDKSPIVFVHGWNGLSGSCDWVEPDGYFQQVDDLLRSAGYYVGYAYLESSGCYTPPIEENAVHLENAIQAAKAATNRPQVILIAHSMGGLVARAYIEGATYDGDVARLFTFGSPHWGVPDDLLAFFANGLSLGAYCDQYQPAVCDFSLTGMLLFNQNHANRRAGVKYHVISGDAPFRPRSALGMAADFLLPGADDGAVQAWSGAGLDGFVDRWRTDETHGSGSGPRNYFVRDGGQSTSYLQCLKRMLVDNPPTDRCGASSWAEQTPDASQSPGSRSPFLYAEVLPGQTSNRAISVEGGATTFVAQWQPGVVSVTLVSPSGQIIDPAYAAANPGVVSYDESPGYATYSFPNAASGQWQVRLGAVNVPATGADCTVFASFESTLTMAAGTDRDWYAPGATAVISATLSPTPQSASVTATVLLPDGSSASVALTPLGGGRFLGYYLAPAMPGFVEVRLNAAGVNSSGVAFGRGASLAFQISADSVALNGSYSDTPEPRWPGATVYQALRVSVGVTVHTAGRYGLSADLVDSSGNPVAHANVVADLSSGAQTLVLRFDGAEIYESQYDGPYRLTGLLLTDHNGATLIVQEAQNVFTTAAYRYRDFRTGDLFLPVIMR